MEDRVLTVKRAKAKQAAIEAAGGKGPGKSAAPVAPLPLDTSSRVVYVGNLPWEVDEEVLAATFEVRDPLALYLLNPGSDPALPPGTAD
jgi:hypothetical protein